MSRFEYESEEGLKVIKKEKLSPKQENKDIEKSEDIIIIDDPIPLSGEQYMSRDKFLEIYKKFFKE